MGNKYLEKIAGAAGIGSALGSVATSLGRVARNGAKAVGTQIHLASGGAFRDHAHDVLGIKDPGKLMSFGSGKDKINNLRNATVNKLAKGQGFTAQKKVIEDFRKNTVPGLQKKQLDARITVGGIGAIGAIGAIKAKNKIDEYNQGANQKTYYNQY